MQAAESLSAHRSAAAQDLRRRESARRGEIGPHSHLRCAEAQTLSFADGETASRRDGLFFQCRCEVGATQSQAAICLGEQSQIAERDFHRGGMKWITQQPVGPGLRYPIGSTALGHTKMTDAESTAVLQAGQGAAALDQQGHDVTS